VGEGEEGVKIPSLQVSESPSLQVFKTKARKAYIKKFPFAIAAKLDLWVLQLEYVKMTDNRLGFGRKIVWRRGDGEKGRRGERIE